LNGWPLPKSLANVVASGWSILPVGNFQMTSTCWQFPWVLRSSTDFGHDCRGYTKTKA
jgi:hypothetical protein